MLPNPNIIQESRIQDEDSSKELIGRVIDSSLVCKSNKIIVVYCIVNTVEGSGIKVKGRVWSVRELRIG
jgi:hypothetical protein